MVLSSRIFSSMMGNLLLFHTKINVCLIDRSELGKVKIPVQHHLMCHRWHGSISMTMDLSQARSHALIKSAGRHVNILGLDLHLRTTTSAGPFGCIPEKRDTQLHAASGRTRISHNTDRSLRASSMNTPVVSNATAAAPTG